MATNQTECKKCGNCCKGGGPALHIQDMQLLQEGRIPLSSLITIRKGELAHNPLTGEIQPVKAELIKITGKGKDWCCCFYNDQNGCVIYDRRPYACQQLKCWATDAILALIEKDTLCRFDIIASDSALLPIIKAYDRTFPCENLQHMQMHLRQLPVEEQKMWEDRVNEDLQFRAKVVAQFQLQLCDELFYFGRPLFQLLRAIGVGMVESPTGLKLRWGNSAP